MLSQSVVKVEKDEINIKKKKRHMQAPYITLNAKVTLLKHPLLTIFDKTSTLWWRMV